MGTTPLQWGHPTGLDWTSGAAWGCLGLEVGREAGRGHANYFFPCTPQRNAIYVVIVIVYRDMGWLAGLAGICTL